MQEQLNERWYPVPIWLSYCTRFFPLTPKRTSSTEELDCAQSVPQPKRTSDISSAADTNPAPHGDKLSCETSETSYLIASNSSPLLSGLLLEGIRQWFTSESDIHLCPEAFHPSLRSIIYQQNRIGWGQLFLGRFGISWSSHQQGYSCHHQSRASADMKSQSLSWQTNLIRFVWERWYTLWKQRNQEVHGHDARTRREAVRREVRRTLNDIYSHRIMYEENVQALLLPNVEDHEQQTVRVTENWLALNAPIFRESFRRVKQRALGGMRSIRTYFGRP